MFGLVALWAIPALVPIVVVFMIVPMLAISAALGGVTWPFEAIVIAGLTVLVVYSVALSLFRGLYTCALYIYATEGVVPEPLTPDDMDAGWKIKGA